MYEKIKLQLTEPQFINYLFIFQSYISTATHLISTGSKFTTTCRQKI